MNVRREELRKDSPDMHHLEVTKKIGEEWMALSEEKKEPFLEAAKQDKIRYQIQFKRRFRMNFLCDHFTNYLI